MKNRKKIIQLLILIIAALLLLFFPTIRNSLDQNTESMFYLFKGETQPDTNIIIIHISSDDIENIGPWPIKRSYYALIINSLRNYGVKKIGLEIFLSAKFSTQAIYDNLLAREIGKSGNVILSSVAGKINYADGIYSTDSLSYPTPKLLNENIPTGHINFIKGKNIGIPAVLNGREKEKAFSIQLFDKNKAGFRNLINVNFLSSWRKFRNYTLLEYFGMVRQKSPGLGSFKNKIILIGLSDPEFAPVFKTAFDDSLPGIALHAFAADNILNDRYLKTELYFPSSIFFFIIIALTLMIKNTSSYKKNLFTCLITLIIFLAVSFILFSYLRIQLDYTAFIMPLILLAASELVFFTVERKNQLKGLSDEAQILKSLLKKKEQELGILQNELEIPDNQSSSALLGKIKSLMHDINKLKEKETDKQESLINFSAEVKNFYGIIYKSKIMEKTVELIKKAAPGNATILITGESGTGKELAARAIHLLSERRGNNFIAVNCGALSETLLESELFGHVKGSFTGAAADRIGRFEAADKGTIFLDEIADTSENFQVKLLRVIQSGDFEKVGSAKTIHSDMRIVAATNKDLTSAVREKKFREDLYYRLNVVKIDLPPLRERKEDIGVIASHFLQTESGGMKLSQAALEALNKFDWKGNVRQLESAVKRSVIFAGSAGRNLIKLQDLPDEIVQDVNINFEDLIIESLRKKHFSHSSINETAEELGGLNRTIVSENFRGFVFKTLVQNNFDSGHSIRLITGTESKEAEQRVRSKLERYLSNIESDLKKTGEKNFETVKVLFASKYKNLPQKFHYYLDEIIKKYLRDEELFKK